MPLGDEVERACGARPALALVASANGSQTIAGSTPPHLRVRCAQPLGGREDAARSPGLRGLVDHGGIQISADVTLVHSNDRRLEAFEQAQTQLASRLALRRSPGIEPQADANATGHGFRINM